MNSLLLGAKYLDASQAYSQAAWMLDEHLHAIEEAASLYTEAAFCLQKVESGEKHFSKTSRVVLFKNI